MEKTHVDVHLLLIQVHVHLYMYTCMNKSVLFLLEESHSLMLVFLVFRLTNELSCVLIISSLYNKVKVFVDLCDNLVTVHN